MVFGVNRCSVPDVLRWKVRCACIAHKVPTHNIVQIHSIVHLYHLIIV